jgi:hypothetical protein
VVFQLKEITDCDYQQWINLQHIRQRYEPNAASVIRTCHSRAIDDVIDTD